MTRVLVRPGLVYARREQSLLVVGTRGDCGGGEPLSGFYYREARHLSALRLALNGEGPWLCEAAAETPHAPAFRGRRSGLARDAAHWPGVRGA